MTRNRSPQTFEKRRRENEKRLRRESKFAAKQARRAAKKHASGQPPASAAGEAAVPDMGTVRRTEGAP